jgi:hypothetical protein
MKWLVQRYQPISTVECPDFRHMINCANPRIQLPSTRLFKERLLTWKLKLERILEEMTKDEVEACTSDSWTSVSNESYTSLTRHFVDRYWELLSLPIDCVKHVGNSAKWNKFACGKVGLGEQSLFGEGASRAEVADAPRCRCHTNRLGVSGCGGRLIFSIRSPLA